jgi:hypothetical protein
MIDLVVSPASSYFSPKTQILLLTPPPFLTETWTRQHIAWALGEGRATTAEEAVYGTEREGDLTHRYALACVDVARQTGVHCVDIHSGLIEAAGGTLEEQLKPYFT